MHSHGVESIYLKSIASKWRRFSASQCVYSDSSYSNNFKERTMRNKYRQSKSCFSWHWSYWLSPTFSLLAWLSNVTEILQTGRKQIFWGLRSRLKLWCGVDIEVEFAIEIGVRLRLGVECGIEIDIKGELDVESETEIEIDEWDGDRGWVEKEIELEVGADWSYARLG